MAGRGDELNTRLTATDDASAVVDKFAEKVESLEDDPHIAKVDADTSDAVAKVSKLDGRLQDLTNEERVTTLKVKADQAERDLRKINRDLANAHKFDDDEIAIKIAAKGTIKQDLDEIRAEMEALEDVDPGPGFSSKLSGSLGNLPGKFGELGGKLGDATGKGLIGGFVALGVGKILADSLSAAFERAMARNITRGQFGLSKDEAREAGTLAGGVYAAGFGDSLGEVSEAFVRLKRDGAGAINESDASLQRLTATALTIGQTFDVSVGEVLRSASQLVENGLVPSLDAAFDLIVSGFQEGANEAGDFLETIDEYAQHFDAVGLSGEEALGKILHGLKNGQRDADKMADAIKEMRTKIVENSDEVREALENIGLDADRIVEAFLAGGPAAKEAFYDVIGALQAGQAAGGDTAEAVAIIGSAFEDLGRDALDSLAVVDGGLENTTGKAQELNDTLSEGRSWEELERRGKSAFASIGDALARQVLPGIEGVDSAIGGLQNKVNGRGFFEASELEKEQERIRKIAEATEALEGKYASARVPGRRMREDIEAIGEAAVDTAGDLGTLGPAAEEAFDYVATAADLFEQRVHKASKLPLEIARNAFSDYTTDAERLLNEAADNLADESRFARMIEQLDAQTEAALELKEARNTDDEIAAEQRYLDVQRRTRGEVIDFLRDVKDLPAEQVVKILADLEAGNVAAVEQRLNVLTENRFVEIVAEIKASITSGLQDVTGNFARGRAPTVTINRTPAPEGSYPYTVGSQPITYNTTNHFLTSNPTDATANLRRDTARGNTTRTSTPI